MSEQKGFDTSHPDFPQYKREFEAIVKEMHEEEERVEKENADYVGLDGPVEAINKKHVLRIMALQKRYAYMRKQA